MVTLTADQYIDEKLNDLYPLFRYHLQNNHYPPISMELLPVAHWAIKKAIDSVESQVEYVFEGDYEDGVMEIVGETLLKERWVGEPKFTKHEDGSNPTALDIIEWFNLEHFINLLYVAMAEFMLEQGKAEADATGNDN